MKDVFVGEIWYSGTIQVHIDTPLIPLINFEPLRKNTETNYFKIKLRRNVGLFENRKPEEFRPSCGISE